MSRVYNAITGATRPYVPSPPELPDDGVWENAEDAPFIEIGGPEGPVCSEAIGRDAASDRLDHLPEPRAEHRVGKPSEVKPTGATTTREFPRLASEPAASPYLVIRFHEVSSRPTAAPVDGLDPSLVVLHDPHHPVAAEYRRLRDEICRQLSPAKAGVLFFTAATARAGTTTVVANLAVTLASEATARVLLVDGNVSRPDAAAWVGAKSVPGLCEVLTQSVPLAWAVQPSAVANLHVLAAGRSNETTPAALGHDLPHLLGQLRRWYDWVVVDSGVWGEIPERDAACPAADAVYLVTREGDVERTEFLALRSWVRELGGLLRGYVATAAA